MKLEKFMKHSLILDLLYMIECVNWNHHS